MGQLQRAFARLSNSSSLRTITRSIALIWRAFLRPIRLFLAIPRLTIARFLVARGKWEAVIRVLTPHLHGRELIVRSARVVISCYGKVGDFDNAYLVADRLARQTRNASHIRKADQLRGRLLEVHPAWIPSAGRVTTYTPPAKRRVLYLAKESAPYLHNGFCTRSHETLRAVRDTGTEIVAVTMPGFPAVIGINDGPNHVEVDGISYHHLMPHLKELTELPANEYLDLSASLLARFIEQYQPSVLHIGSGHRGFETALVGRAVAEAFNLPWIYEVRSFFETTWTSDRRYMESAPYFHQRHATETRSMQAADFVVTLSGPMKDEIVHQHRVPADNVAGIPNAVDLDRFAPTSPDLALKERLGLEGAFVLGYVSNLSHPREGQEGMIEALPLIRQAGINAKVLLVGDGPRREMLKQRASKLGVNQHVVFTGSIPFTEVAPYYSVIDLFVIPRINERAGRLVSPMKPFEAMSMEIPILVSDLPALTEIVADGRGFAYRAEDPADMARVAVQLAKDPESLKQAVATAAEWVRRERTWAAAGRAFVSAYENAERNHGGAK